MGHWPLLLLFVALTFSAVVQIRGASQEDRTFKQLRQSGTLRATSRPTRVPTCSSKQFRCRNNQCIDIEQLCDGIKDCRDGSDETESECNRSDLTCNPLTYRCGYGACVDGDARCNGSIECADGSDEAGCPRRENTTPSTNRPTSCRSDQFRCTSGQCIERTQLCDGRVHCFDRTDETAEACADFECPGYAFRCRYGACIDRDLKCNNEVNCADGSDEDYELCGRPRPTRPSNTGSSSNENTSSSGNRVTTPSPSTPTAKESCNLPEQPENGEWKLDKSLCSNNRPCRPQKGVHQLDPGTQLVFSCNQGYKLNGTKDVFCGLQGKWSAIPKCIEIKCPALSSAALDARCRFDGSWVSCDNPVPVKTVAELSCRNSYVPDTTDLTSRKTVNCNATGEWEPNPIKCVSVCGVPSTGVGTPLIVNGTAAKVAEFPWHATLYMANKNEKQFICGATIIKENLLVTAAHCIYDEVTKKPHNPSKFYIAVGNIFRDYDYDGHDPRTVKKARVKDIYIVCNYLGLEGNYASDIAILQIDQSFTFSSIIMPICLDVSAAGDQEALEAGNYGKVAGFGRTAKGASSFVLQTLSVPYVPLNTCKTSSQASDSARYITIDKFCAGYTNGSSVCDGDSGGGLVFKSDNKWYLRGIVSVGIGVTRNGAITTCNSHAYALYTRVSSHMEWIQDIILRVDTNRPMRVC